MSQCDEILGMLKRGEKVTPLEALRKAGVFRLAARVEELRADGYPIKTEMVEDRRTGKRFASYYLGAK